MIKQLHDYTFKFAYILLLVGTNFTLKVDAATESASTSIIPDYFFSDSLLADNHILDGIEALFDYYKFDIDTVGWSTKKINNRSDDQEYKITDTMKIVLADSGRSDGFVFPFKNYITSPFGPRGIFYHFGIDIKLLAGDTVQCAKDGLVRIVQNDKRGYGKVIVVRHQNGLETVYGHLSKCLVAPNDRVNAGDVIGLGGNSGRSTGSHLHFEIRYNGQPFDPLTIMNFESYSLLSDTLVISPQLFEYEYELKSTVFHKVKKGETLGSIAGKYRVSIQKICILNNITPRAILKIGRALVVRKGDSKQAATDTLQRLVGATPEQIAP